MSDPCTEPRRCPLFGTKRSHPTRTGKWSPSRHMIAGNDGWFAVPLLATKIRLDPLKREEAPNTSSLRMTVMPRELPSTVITCTVIPSSSERTNTPSLGIAPTRQSTKQLGQRNRNWVWIPSSLESQCSSIVSRLLQLLHATTLSVIQVCRNYSFSPAPVRKSDSTSHIPQSFRSFMSCGYSLQSATYYSAVGSYPL